MHIHPNRKQAIDMTFTGDTRNNQDILDYFVDVFMINSIPRCVNEVQQCRYAPQHEGQVGCAIGCLIPIEDSKRWDTLRRNTVVDHGALTIKGIKNGFPWEYNKYFDPEQEEFLRRLQVMHDAKLRDHRANHTTATQSAQAKNDFMRGLDMIARTYDLILKEIP